MPRWRCAQALSVSEANPSLLRAELERMKERCSRHIARPTASLAIRRAVRLPLARKSNRRRCL